MNDNTIERFWEIYNVDLINFVNHTQLSKSDYILNYANWRYDTLKWKMEENMKVSLSDMHSALYEFIAIKQNYSIAKFINPSFEYLTSEEASIDIEHTAEGVLKDSEAIVGNILNFHFELPKPDQGSSQKYADNIGLFIALVGMNNNNPVTLLRLMRNNVHAEETDNSLKPRYLSNRRDDLMQVLRFAVFTFLFIVALCRKSIYYYHQPQNCSKLCKGKYEDKYKDKLKDYFNKKNVDSVLQKFSPKSFTAYFSLEKQFKGALSVQWSVGGRNNTVNVKELNDPIVIEDLHSHETVVMDITLDDAEQSQKNIVIDLGNRSTDVSYKVNYEDASATEDKRASEDTRVAEDIRGYLYDKCHYAKYHYRYARSGVGYDCFFSLGSCHVDVDNRYIHISWNVSVIFKEGINSFNIKDLSMPGRDDITLTSYGFTIYEKIASIEFDSEEIRHDMLWEDDRHSDYFSDTITELDLRAYSGKTIRMGKRFTNLKRSYLGKGDVVSAESFRECTKLKTVVVKGEGEYTIGDMAFYGCSSLKSIVVPQEFGNEAFAGCTALKDVSFPKGLKRIGNQAFEGCQSLKAIDMPDGLEEIGQGAFRHAGLEKILFPASVKKIGESAFYGCSSLEKLCFPNGCGVEEMHDKAFMDCPNLKKIVIRDKEVTIQEYIDNYKPSVFEDVFDSSYSYEIFGPNKPNNFTRWLDAFMKNLEKTFEDL